MDFNKSKTLPSSSSHSRSSLLLLLLVVVVVLHEMVFSLSLSFSLCVYYSSPFFSSKTSSSSSSKICKVENAYSTSTSWNNSPSHAFLISVIPRLHRSRISLLAPPLASLATPSSFCGQRASFWEVVFLSSSSKASSRVSRIDYAILVHSSSSAKSA